MAVAGELQALPFGSLIGGPLDAAIEAQARAALSSVNFIKQIGFQEGEGETADQIRNIAFVVKKGETETRIEVPLLTIVPIPFIRIDEMTIDFKANITSTTESEDKTVESTSAGGKVNASARYLFFKAELEASFSSKKDSESTRSSRYAVETTIDVHVHACQDELPAGLAKMLNILADTIQAPQPTAPPAGGEEETETNNNRRRRNPPSGD